MSELVAFFVVIGAIGLAVLAVLAPYFIYRIKVEAQNTNKLLIKLVAQGVMS